MKGQDILLLLKLISLEEQGNNAGTSASALRKKVTIRSLADSVSMSKSETNLALRRLVECGLARKSLLAPAMPRPKRKDFFCFVRCGLKYVFPAKITGISRGILTAFSAPAAEGLIEADPSIPYVWADSDARVKGKAVSPLYPAVPKAAIQDKTLYDYLVLVDIIRMGKARDAEFAEQRLKKLWNI